MSPSPSPSRPRIAEEIIILTCDLFVSLLFPYLVLRDPLELGEDLEPLREVPGASAAAGARALLAALAVAAAAAAVPLAQGQVRVDGVLLEELGCKIRRTRV